MFIGNLFGDCPRSPKGWETEDGQPPLGGWQIKVCRGATVGFDQFLISVTVKLQVVAAPVIFATK